MEGKPLLESSMTGTYPVRWYLLCVLCLHSCIFNAVWAEWGSIAQSVKATYGWTDGTVNMLVNYGNIGTAVATLPIAWMVDVKGLRISMLVSTAVMAVGLGMKCIPTSNTVITVLTSIGQFLNGVGGAVASVAPAVLSEIWFPLQERNTATCVSLLFASVGAAIAFVVGPAIVPEPDWKNSTNFNTSSMNINITRFLSNRSVIDRNVRILNLAEFGVSLMVMILVFYHFPNKPKLPPSRTAKTIRYRFFDGIKIILGNGVFWHIALTFAIPGGIYGIWITVLDVILHPFGITQTEAGWLSFSGNLGGVVIGFVLSRFSDFFLKRTKSIMIPAYVMSVTMFVVFLCMVTGVLEGSKGMIYFLCISGSSLVAGVMPLYYGLACECTYPAAEGTTSAIINLAMNVSGVVFILLTLIPALGDAWKTWSMIGGFALTIVSLIFVNVKYVKVELDLNVMEDSAEDNDPCTINDKRSQTTTGDYRS